MATNKKVTMNKGAAFISVDSARVSHYEKLGYKKVEQKSTSRRERGENKPFGQM